MVVIGWWVVDGRGFVVVGWLVVGGWWLVDGGGWWLVDGGWWLVVGGVVRAARHQVEDDTRCE